MTAVFNVVPDIDIRHVVPALTPRWTRVRPGSDSVPAVARLKFYVLALFRFFFVLFRAESTFLVSNGWIV